VELEYKSFGKLNLYLKVLSYDEERRLHKLSMINTEITLSDEIYLELDYPGKGLIKIDMIPGFEILKENNLIFKAVKLFMRESRILFNTSFKVKKNIPPGSGLGGGSSNASYTLLTLNKMFRKFSSSELKKLASLIGCDVAFFIHGGLCKAKGFGEIVEPLYVPDFKGYTFIVIIPPFSLSTKEVYEKYDILREEKLLPPINEDILLDGTFPIRNDLYEPARLIRSGIEEIIYDLKKVDPVFSSMTGSGSGCFSIFKDYDKAFNAYSMFKKKYEKTYLLKPKLSKNI